jgi:rhamnosyltransferase
LLIIDNSVEGSLKNQGINFTANTVIINNYNKDTLAGAFNIALEYARNNGFKYLHLFDQDTLPPENITSGLLKNFEEEGPVAVVSPRFINSSTNFPGRVLTPVTKWRTKSFWPKTDIGLLNVLFTISSASLINLSRVPENAFYDTRVVVDGVDIDFCLYLREAGLQIVVDTSVVVYHGLGARKKGGGRWSATNYSPLRKQLSSKNRMMIWRRYRGNFPGYVLNDVFVFFLDSIRTLVLEKKRFAKMKALAKGLWQGLREKNIAKRVFQGVTSTSDY